MIRRLILLFLGVLLTCPAVQAGTPGRFPQSPDISGHTIVFTWERDLWTVPAAGGVAQRLTTHPGTEGRRQVSRPTASGSRSRGNTTAPTSTSFRRPAACPGASLSSAPAPARWRGRPDGERNSMFRPGPREHVPVRGREALLGERPKEACRAVPMERGHPLLRTSPDGSKTRLQPTGHRG